MKTSFYQLMKLDILSAVHLSRDAVHIYVGLFCLLLYVIVFRKRIDAWWSLLPVLLLAMGMESLDLHDDYQSLGYFRWGASLHDIINTLFWPFVIVTLFKFRILKIRDRKQF